MLYALYQEIKKNSHSFELFRIIYSGVKGFDTVKAFDNQTIQEYINQIDK